ncbi:galactose-specific lectin nattectin-like [Halichoeres trimaculatus]|uniref:galactose-specific lectin nattectin-like n=1 Tax=Halichoeres trimaculatus TaxID=147232 RepID=UPI003D9F0442
MSCPEEWITYKDRCFKFFYDPKEWSAAETKCVSEGGNLASPRDAEVDYYRGLVKQLAGRPIRTWFGAFKINVGTWKFSKGDRFVFTSWGKGEPSDTVGKENCMEMMDTAKQIFNDAPCSAKKAFLCVRDKMATN